MFKKRKTEQEELTTLELAETTEETTAEVETEKVEKKKKKDEDFLNRSKILLLVTLCFLFKYKDYINPLISFSSSNKFCIWFFSFCSSLYST